MYTVPPIDNISFAFGAEAPTDMIVDGVLVNGQLNSLTCESNAKNIVGGTLT
jgi:hypothetical protein